MVRRYNCRCLHVREYQIERRKYEVQDRTWSEGKGPGDPLHPSINVDFENQNFLGTKQAAPRGGSAHTTVHGPLRAQMPPTDLSGGLLDAQPSLLT